MKQEKDKLKDAKLKDAKLKDAKLDSLSGAYQSSTNVETTYQSNPYKVLENKYTLVELTLPAEKTAQKEKIIWRINRVSINVLGVKDSTIVTNNRKRDIIVSEETGLSIDPFPIDMRDSSYDYLTLKQNSTGAIILTDTFIKKTHLGFNYYLTTNEANDTVIPVKKSKFDPGWGNNNDVGILKGYATRIGINGDFSNLKNDVRVLAHDVNNSKWTFEKILPDNIDDNTYHIKVKGTNKYLCAELIKSVASISNNDEDLLLQFSKWLRSNVGQLREYMSLLYKYTYMDILTPESSLQSINIDGGFRLKHVYSNYYLRYSFISGNRRLKLMPIYSNLNMSYEESVRTSRPYHVSNNLNFENLRIANYIEDGVLRFGNFDRAPSIDSFMLIPVNKPSALTGYSEKDIFYALITNVKLDFPTTFRKALFVLEFNPIIKTSLIKDDILLRGETSGLFETRNTIIKTLFSKFLDVRKEYKFACCNLVNKIYGAGNTDTTYSRKICLDTNHAITADNTSGERLCIPFMNDYCKESENTDPVKANIITNIKDPVCGCYDKTSVIPLLAPLYGYLTNMDNVILRDENGVNGNIANKEKCFFAKCQEGTDAFMSEAQKGVNCPSFCGVIKTNIAEANSRITESGNTYEVSCNSNSSGPASIVLNECINVVTFPQGQCNQPCSSNQTITSLAKIVKKNNTSQLCEVPNNSVPTIIKCNDRGPNNAAAPCSAFTVPPVPPVVPPVPPVVPPVPPIVPPVPPIVPPVPPVVPPTGEDKDSGDIIENPTSIQKDEGLSNGAIAGIAVGSILGVSIIGFVVYKYYKSSEQGNEYETLNQ